MPGAARALHRLGRIDARRLEQHQTGTFRRLKYLDVGKPFPFRDDAMTAIFSAHLLEHLPPTISRNFINECHRVLSPGGVIRTAVPDLDLAVARYDSSNPEPFLDAMYESRQEGKNRHHWMYNEQSLRRLLEESGFRDIVRCAFGEGDCPDLEKLDNRPESTLFVEATK